MNAPEIRLTRVKKAGGALLCKRITLTDGRPQGDGRPCAMSLGSAQRVALNGSPAANLAELLSDLGSHEAILLGDIAEGLGDRIELETEKNADPANGVYSRTKKYLAFRKGEPSPVLVDYDQKAMPAAVRTRIEALGGFEAALASILPGYNELARVVRASTSAGLYHSETNEPFPASGGKHVYLFATDGADSKRFLEDLQKRAWLAGLGWIMVAARGALLIRSIVDVSVGSPGPVRKSCPLTGGVDRAGRRAGQ